MLRYLLLLFFILVVLIIVGVASFYIFSVFERRDKEKGKRKLVFKSSAGWLLFWLIIAPPIGYIWLILGMEEEKIKG